ncbi:hypothetical protein MVEN_00268600 [Mycena venus]|uniref:Uncharacterized protein n=1 Tax=Mycena venus TaxID=2733690 RepID=A0A8H6Z3X2_9AGAR|nr:hypothetical protein MVEN_00268600 [Mycena venus]
MSCQGHESKTVIHCDIHGGQGGPGGLSYGKGGSGGLGEGPTMIFKEVQNLTNNMYVGEASAIPFPQQQQCEPGLKEVLDKWLEFPPDMKDRQYDLRSLHHQATGSWLLVDGRFMRWKATPGSLWIKGICNWYWKKCTKFNSD